MSAENTGSTLLSRLLADRTIPEIRTLRAELKGELESAKAHVTRVEQDIAELDHVIAERTAGRTTERPKSRNGRPSRTGGASLRAMILAVMSEHPGPWSTRDVYDTLIERGAAPEGKKPLNTVGSRLLEMVKRGEVRRVDRGRFSLTEDGTAQAEQQSLNEEEVPAA
jgi:hypothetical protein